MVHATTAPATKQAATLLVPPLLLEAVSLEGAQALANALAWRIMLIDDDALFCRQFMELAHQRGMTVDAFASPAELDWDTCFETYDLGLLSYSLKAGERECVELAQRVRSLDADFPLVFVSSESRTRLPRRLLQGGACVSVRKRDGLGHIFARALRLVADRAA